jgi:hypothetical protein
MTEVMEIDQPTITAFKSSPKLKECHRSLSLRTQKALRVAPTGLTVVLIMINSTVLLWSKNDTTDPQLNPYHLID